MSKVNDLKAEAYDLIAEFEKYQAAIQEIQKKLNEKNAEILKEMEAGKESDEFTPVTD